MHKNYQERSKEFINAETEKIKLRYKRSLAWQYKDTEGIDLKQFGFTIEQLEEGDPDESSCIFSFKDITSTARKLLDPTYVDSKKEELAENTSFIKREVLAA